MSLRTSAGVLARPSPHSVAIPNFGRTFRAALARLSEGINDGQGCRQADLKARSGLNFAGIPRPNKLLVGSARLTGITTRSAKAIPASPLLRTATFCG